MTKVMDGGRLRMQMTLRDGRVAAISATSSRPAAAGLLRGRSVAEAQTLVPRLFSLCGAAQAAACRAACAAAAGAASDRGALSRLDAARTVVEAGQEHLWRLLLDWPGLLGQAVRQADFVVWHKRLGEAGKLLEAARCAGDPAAAAAALAALPRLAAAFEGFLDAAVFAPATAAELRAGGMLSADAWAGRLLAAAGEAAERPAAGLPLPPQLPPQLPRLLPRLAAADWAAHLDSWADDFAARPSFDGVPAETGALARQASQPLVAAQLVAGDAVAARLAARLIDLAVLPAALAAPPPRIDAVGTVNAGGAGLACVETARGLLIHMVRLAGQRIEDYAVIAPTEWNFHPAGAWQDTLLGRQVADAASGEGMLRRIVLALDPCVPVSVEVIAHAAGPSAVVPNVPIRP